MGKKKPQPKPSPPARKTRVWWLYGVAILGIAALAAFLFRRGAEPAPDLPPIDFTVMEPQVAAKVQEHVDQVRETPRLGTAWGRLGMVLQAHGLEREAAHCYEAAIELEPRELRWHYLLTHALRGFEPESALAQSETTLQIDPSYAAAHLIRGEMLEERGESEAARHHYEEAWALDSENPMAAFATGRFYLAEGDLEKARERLDRAAALDPEAGPVHGALARLYRRLGEPEKAMTEAALAAEKSAAVAITDPIHVEMRQESVSSLAQLDRARTAAEAGDFSRAETIYRELVELRPDDADMHARLGDVLALQSRIDDAKKHYRTALDLNPEHASAHYGLGNMLNASGAHDDAEKHYRRALEAQPDHVATMVNLGSLAAFRGNADEAEALFRRALEVEPDAFGPRRQLGELYLRQKQWRPAIEELERALEARPDFGPVHLELAVAHASVGDFQSALEHARKAAASGATVPDGMLRELEQRAGASRG